MLIRCRIATAATTISSTVDKVSANEKKTRTHRDNPCTHKRMIFEAASNNTFCTPSMMGGGGTVMGKGGWRRALAPTALRSAAADACYFFSRGAVAAGFGFGFGKGTCLIFLIPGLVINTAWKYVVALLACLLLGVLVEALRVVRSRIRELRRNWSRGVDAVLYAVQMFVAYCAMLLVMTYELFFIAAIVIGLALGHLLLEPYTKAKSAGSSERHSDAAERKSLLAAVNDDGSDRDGGASQATSPCCGDN